MSPERTEQNDFLEDEEQDEYEGQRSIFATGWFRAVLVLLVLAVIAVIAVPLIGGWFEPTPPPKLATPAPKPVAPPPAAAPSTPTPAPATSPVPGQSAAAPSPAAPAPVIPPASTTPTPAPTPPPVASTPAPARPEIPPASASTKTAEKADKAKAPERTAALAPSKSSNSKAPAPAAGAGNYWVQVGAFKDSRNAEGLAKALRSQGFPVQVAQLTRDAPLHVVRVGGYPDRSRASTAREDLQGKGHTGFVTSGPPK